MCRCGLGSMIRLERGSRILIPKARAALPTTFGSDPLGLWSTAALNAITDECGRQLGWPQGWIDAMKRGSYAADHGDRYQDPAPTFIHAMSSGKLSKEQACKMLNGFVGDAVT